MTSTGCEMGVLTFRPGVFRQNLDTVWNLCAGRGLDLLTVTKVVQSRPDILGSVVHPGLAHVADVYPANFGPLDPGGYPDRAVLRPLSADAPLTARYATRAFLSDPRLGRVLSAARVAAGGPPLGIWVMVEAGDLRDGVPWDEVPGVVCSLAGLPGLEVRGLAVNLGCLAGALPDPGLLGRLAEGLVRVRRRTGLPVPGFSVGGTVFWEILYAAEVPPEITELRLGEAVFFGWDTSSGRPVRGLSADVFRLDLEVLETWTKEVSPVPPGFTGLNAFGERAAPGPAGTRGRSVLEGGLNLAPQKGLQSLSPGCTVVGETHEYTVVDWTEAVEPPEAGGVLGFRPTYEAVTRCFLSPHLTVQMGGESC